MISIVQARGGVDPSLQVTLAGTEYLEDGRVSIGGAVSTSSTEPVVIAWNWGDGLWNNSLFPAVHQYTSNGVYGVTVIASQNGQPAVTNTTSVAITNALEGATREYRADFETAGGGEWSKTTRAITPVGGRRFLGEFSVDTVSLTLTNMAPHSRVRLEFDLYLIRSWDGSVSGFGPDIFRVVVPGVSTLLSTTFSLTDNKQAYPQTYPSSLAWGGAAGAAERGTLGYSYGSSADWGSDAVYRLQFEFQHSSKTLTVNFAGSGLEGVQNEAWGLDNVLVRGIEGAAVGAPYIWASPLDRIGHPGEDLFLQAGVGGASPIQYQWFKNGLPVPGGTSALLPLQNASAQKAGQYHLVARNTLGETSSAPVLVQIGESPSIQVLAAHDRLFSDADAQMSTKVIGPGPYRYEWRKDGQVMIGQTNESLVLSRVRPSGSATYICQVTTPFGRAKDLARLWVDSPFPTAQPIILTGWNRDVVFEASTTSVAQDFDGAGYAWFEAGWNGHPNGFPSDRQFTSAANENVRFAFRPFDGPNAVWLDTTGGPSSATLRLAVPERFKRLAILAATGLSNGTNTSAINLGFTDGTYSGLIGLDVANWLSPGGLSSVAVGGLDRVANTGAYEGLYETGFGLVETDVDMTLKGWDAKELATVLFVNQTPRADARMGLFAISGEPVESWGAPTISESPGSDAILFGGSTRLDVLVRGLYPLYYQWRLDGNAIPGATNTTLFITNALSAHAGIYQVVVSNSVGMATSKEFVLRVGAAPEIGFRAPTEKAWLGRDILLSPIVEGTGPLTLQWRFNNAVLARATNASFLVTNLAPKQVGSYQLTVVSPFGQVSKAVQVQVMGCAADVLPIGLSGWNRDVVLEAASGSLADSWEASPRASAFFESGWLGQGDGLPPNRLLWSTYRTNVLFQFQPYNGKNTLWLSDTQRKGVLLLSTPSRFKRLSVAACSSYGTLANARVILDFADGTHSSQLSINAKDWWTGDATSLALPGLGYAWSELTGPAVTQAGYGDFDGGTRVGAGIRHTDIDLVARGFDTKVLTSLTFTNAASDTRVRTGVFAVSGQPADSSTPPLILSQPVDVMVRLGETATLQVAAMSSLPVSYQWSFQGRILTGETNATLTIPNAQGEQSGGYQVSVSNLAGTVNSASAALTVAAEMKRKALDIQAYIDGRDNLIIRSNAVRWHHLELAAVGRRGGVNEPTRLSTTQIDTGAQTGLDWIPQWPDAPPAEVRYDSFSSSLEQELFLLPQSSMVLELYPLSALGGVSTLQAPSAQNDNTLILQFADNDPSAATWYHARLVMTIPVDAPVLTLRDAGFRLGGKFGFAFEPPAGRGFVIEASSDLTTWSTVEWKAGSAASEIDIIEPNPSDPGGRFFRVRLLP